MGLNPGFKKGIGQRCIKKRYHEHLHNTVENPKIFPPDTPPHSPGCSASARRPIEQHWRPQFCAVGWRRCCMTNFSRCSGREWTEAAGWSCRCLWILGRPRQSCFLWEKPAGGGNTETHWNADCVKRWMTSASYDHDEIMPSQKNNTSCLQKFLHC